MDKIGIFEVDCRERSKEETGLSYVSRALEFKDQIEDIHSYAQDHDLPLVLTTCCANRLLSREDCRGTLVVPMDSEDDSWLREISSSKQIYIEKTTWGSPKKNTMHCAWDMFRHNCNAEKLFKNLDVKKWVVFGVGIDLCVSSATKGLLQSGCEVVILKDLLVNNAGGDSESMEKMLDHLCELGATTMTHQEFLQGQ